MAFQVRALAERDRPAWLLLFKGYVEFYRADVPDEVIDQTWRRLITVGEGNPVGLVVVDEGDVPFGIAHMLFHRSTWSPTWYCYLEDLFVDPARRAGGAGRALIDAVYAEADTRGCTRTYWDFFEGRTAGARFTISTAGWTRIEEKARTYGVKPEHRRVSLNWPSVPHDDLRVILDVCERETDDALGILVKFCVSITGHTRRMYARRGLECRR
jgi:GNAT superfamily N-acetyltransferase